MRPSISQNEYQAAASTLDQIMDQIINDSGEAEFDSVMSFTRDHLMPYYKACLDQMGQDLPQKWSEDFEADSITQVSLPPAGPHFALRVIQSILEDADMAGVTEMSVRLVMPVYLKKAEEENYAIPNEIKSLLGMDSEEKLNLSAPRDLNPRRDALIHEIEKFLEVTDCSAMSESIRKKMDSLIQSVFYREADRMPNSDELRAVYIAGIREFSEAAPRLRENIRIHAANRDPEKGPPPTIEMSDIEFHLYESVRSALSDIRSSAEALEDDEPVELHNDFEGDLED